MRLKLKMLIMKKDIKGKIIDKILNIFTIIVPLIILLWISGMIFKWINGVTANDFSFFLTYGQITLTLFGFTMISAIFEKGKNKSKELKNLFYLSILFLLSSISFFYLYFSSFLILNTDWLQKLNTYIYLGALAIGFAGFVYGIFLLLQILLKFAKKV